jgi:hypothetical protein
MVRVTDPDMYHNLAVLITHGRYRAYRRQAYQHMSILRHGLGGQHISVSTGKEQLGWVIGHPWQTTVYIGRCEAECRWS